MVSELAKQAVNIKCGFENAKMTGNYECAYALGIVSKAAGIEKNTEFNNLLGILDIRLKNLYRCFQIMRPQKYLMSR